MKQFHLHIAATVLFSLFAAASGAFASTHDGSELTAEDAPVEIDADECRLRAENCTCDPPLESMDYGDSLVSNPAELQKCLAACKAGGATILRYCGTMPTPQLRVMCISASMVGTVSCMGFCYARFVD